MAATESSADGGNPVRGAGVGMLLGAGMWTALVFGIIALLKL